MLSSLERWGHRPREVRAPARGHTARRHLSPSPDRTSHCPDQPAAGHSAHGSPGPARRGRLLIPVPGPGGGRCRIRVIDTFGTEPAYNHEEYATLHGYRTNWGYWNLNPKQFMTMFRECPSHAAWAGPRGGGAPVVLGGGPGGGKVSLPPRHSAGTQPAPTSPRKASSPLQQTCDSRDVSAGVWGWGRGGRAWRERPGGLLAWLRRNAVTFPAPAGRGLCPPRARG